MLGHLKKWPPLLECVFLSLMTRGAYSLPFLSCDQPTYGFTSNSTLFFPLPVGYGKLDRTDLIDDGLNLKFIHVPNSTHSLALSHYGIMANFSASSSFQPQAKFRNCKFYVDISVLTEQPFTGLLATVKDSDSNSPICVSKVHLDRISERSVFDCNKNCTRLDGSRYVVSSFRRGDALFYHTLNWNLSDTLFVVDPG